MTNRLAEIRARMEAGASRTTFQWLVERGQPEGLHAPLWREPSGGGWTDTAHQAAMFSDRASAETYVEAENLEARAVEHGFSSLDEYPARHAPDDIRYLLGEVERLREALLSDDFELWLVHAPLIETSPGCRFAACESEEACTCEEERDA